MVVERSFGDIGGRENGIDDGTLESRSVDFAKAGLQQPFPCALGITNIVISSHLPYQPVGM